MIAMSSPCTPHRDQSKRILDPSPAFSNYYSDDETSPQSSGILKPSPSQSKLLGRLNAIGRQILRKNPSDHERTVLSAELDALEQTLNAPEPQTREPPDINDSGLFIDDEPEEARETDKRGDLEASVAAAQKRLKKEAQKRDELVARVNKLNREFQKRYEEMKHHNDLSIRKLEASAQEILKIRSENHKLKAELHQSHSNFLLLKMQLRGIEVQAAPFTDSTESTELKQSIEQWKSDWKTADERVKSLSEELEHRANGDINSADSTQMSDITSSTLPSGSPRPRKSLLKIIRPALIAQNKADLFTSEDTQGTKANGVARHGGNVEPAIETPEKKAAKSVEFDTADEAEEVSNESDCKSPWQELWDGLADFAGIYDQ